MQFSLLLILNVFNLQNGGDDASSALLCFVTAVLKRPANPLTENNQKDRPSQTLICMIFPHRSLPFPAVSPPHLIIGNKPCQMSLLQRMASCWGRSLVLKDARSKAAQSVSDSLPRIQSCTSISTNFPPPSCFRSDCRSRVLTSMIFLPNSWLLYSIRVMPILISVPPPQVHPLSHLDAT